MSKLRVGINGFGRIGRMTLRALLKKPHIEVVVLNDITGIDTLAHLFRYDTAHGQYPGEVRVQDGNLAIDGHTICVYAEKDPTALPWKDLKVDVVLESTGLFRDKETAGKHLQGGASRVVISAPAKGEVQTIVLGVNDDALQDADDILSNASCTTNCLAPMAKVLDDNWGMVQGYMTTVHAYTADQALQDKPHKDLRRARAAAQNIVPTTTGAAKAVELVLPHLKGKLNGMAMRVPVIDGSITDLTCVLEKEADAGAINRAFEKAAGGPLKGIMEYSEAPLVSSDIIGNPHSCIFDGLSTMSTGKLVKVIGWYDNEAGYSHRLADLIEKLGKG